MTYIQEVIDQKNFIKKQNYLIDLLDLVLMT